MTNTVERKPSKEANHSRPATPPRELTEYTGEHGADKGAGHREDQGVDEALTIGDGAKEVPGEKSTAGRVLRKLRNGSERSNPTSPVLWGPRPALDPVLNSKRVLLPARDEPDDSEPHDLFLHPDPILASVRPPR